MKAYVVLLDNSVQFLWHDSNFAEMLKSLARDSQGTEQPSDNPEDNAHYVEQLLSPLIVSYQILQDAFEDPLSVIMCKKVGCNVVFQKQDDVFYIGFCENGHNAIYNMQKQLHVLREFIAFYLGPCQKNVNPRNGIDRSRTWEKITKAVQSFIELHESEESFLVGGVEKLHFNPDIQQTCFKIIESCMDTLTKNLKREKNFWMLFVKHKMAAYEAGNKINYALSTGDILKVIAVCNSKFKQVDDIDSVEASSAVDAMESSWSDDCDSEPSNSNRFSGLSTYLPRSATIPQRKASMKPPIHVRFHDPEKSSSLPRPGFFVREKVRFGGLTKDKGNHPTHSLSQGEICVQRDEMDGSDDSRERIPLFRPRRKTMPEFRIPEEIGNVSLSHEDIHTMPVFLKTIDCPHTPFLMHSMKISDDVNFVLLSEIGFKADTSPNATKGSLILHINGGIKTYDKLNDCCKDLQSRLRYVSNDRQVRRIVATWENSISKNLRDFLSQKGIRYLDKLERNITELSSMLQTLFQQIFLMKRRSKTNLKEELTVMTLKLKKRFDDHLDFYKAKAMRNLSVSWSHEKYPGLLHFMLVRRWKKVTGISSNGGPILLDELLTSGLHIPTFPEEVVINEDELELRLCLKKQVLRCVLGAYSKVNGQEGLRRYSVSEGDFKGTSFFWTSSGDVGGLPVGVDSLADWNGTASLSGFESPFNRVKCPDKMEGKFVFCELHLLHFSTVPDYTVVKQADMVLENFRLNKYEV